jgi:hypothetical protein
MEACEVVRLFVNKAVVSAEPKRRGNPGYGRLRALRVLVYARLKGLENDTRTVEHLKKHMDVSRTRVTQSAGQNHCGPMVETLSQPFGRDFRKNIQHASTRNADHPLDS